MFGETREGVVIKQWFDTFRVDISLIRLTDEQEPFVKWLRVLAREIQINDNIYVLSLQSNIANQQLEFACESSQVYMVDRGHLFVEPDIML